MSGVFLRKLRKKLVDFASLFWQGDFFFLPGYFPADFDLIKICRCQAAVGGAVDICFTGKGDAAKKFNISLGSVSKYLNS